MAWFQFEFFSTALSRQMRLQMLLPNDLPAEMTAGNPAYERETKTMFFLHGYSASDNEMLMEGNVRALSVKYNLAVVMPSCGNSFYLDAKGRGQAYARYVGEELPAYVSRTFSLSSKPSDVFVSGISMGGFGAIHTGLKYPRTFGKIVGLSSALIIHNIAGAQPGYADGIADYDYYRQVFGDLDTLADSENNPEVLVRRLRESGQAVPPIYMACGSEDFLIRENREFRDVLLEQEAELHYIESPGVHDWKFWNQYLEDSVLWLLQ